MAKENESPDLDHIIDPTRNFHIADPGMRTDDVIDIAFLREEKVWAICGYGWVPTHSRTLDKPCWACYREAKRIVAEEEARRNGEQ